MIGTFVAGAVGTLFVSTTIEPPGLEVLELIDIVHCGPIAIAVTVKVPVEPTDVVAVVEPATAAALPQLFVAV